MTARRISAVVLLIIVASLLGAPQAFAHATRIGADPADGAALSSGPDRVTATFNEQMQSSFAAMTVVGPDGNLWSTGDPEVAGATVGVAVRPLGPTGTYTVNYRATSADGHVVSGSWAFELTTPGPGDPGPPAAAAPESELPVWPFVLGAALIIAGGVVWAVRRRT